MSVISTRTCFISSEENVTQDSRSIQLNFPSQLFNYPPTSTLRIVLNSFSCQRTFYEVNQNNNTLYLFDVTSNTLYPIVITEGDYVTINDARLQTNLASAIADAFNTALMVTETDFAAEELEDYSGFVANAKYTADFGTIY